MLLNFAAPRTPVQTTQVPMQPSIDKNALLNLSDSEYSGLQKVGGTNYYYGNNRMYEQDNRSGGKGSIGGGYTGNAYSPYSSIGNNANKSETIIIDGQRFKTVDPEIAGFNRLETDKKGVYKYVPSMAYLSANKPMSMPAPTPNIMSFLSAPNMNLQPTETSYGAGRFLNSGLMGLDFAAPSGQSND